MVKQCIHIFTIYWRKTIKQNLLLDFRTKPNYAPVIDIVNSLSENFNVFFIPNKLFKPLNLNAKVICCTENDIKKIKPAAIFSSYSTLLKIADLKMKFHLPIINYMFIYMIMRDVLSQNFLALPNRYKVREMLKLSSFFLPKSLLMPNKLIVPNRIVEDELSKFGFPKDRLVTLPWGLDTTKYQPKKFPSNYSLNNNEHFIVYTGPLHSLRFSNRLIYEFANVIKENVNTNILLLFRKDLWNHKLYKELLRIINRLGLTRNVSILSSLSHQEYLSYVSRATVLVLPYYSSGIVEVPPFTLLECMSLSRPVITSQGAATYGIIKDGFNGFIIPEKPQSLSNIINLLLSDKKRALTIGQNARNTVKKDYSLSTFNDKLVNILDSCCK